MSKYPTWFEPFLIQWVTESKINGEPWVQRALALDEDFARVADDVKFSSSVLDVFKLIAEIWEVRFCIFVVCLCICGALGLSLVPASSVQVFFLSFFSFFFLSIIRSFFALLSFFFFYVVLSFFLLPFYLIFHPLFLFLHAHHKPLFFLVLGEPELARVVRHTGASHHNACRQHNIGSQTLCGNLGADSRENGESELNFWSLYLFLFSHAFLFPHKEIL